MRAGVWVHALPFVNLSGVPENCACTFLSLCACLGLAHSVHTLLSSTTLPHAPIAMAPDPAANLLKPALARGDLHCIGATTVGEYRKHIEQDGAFARRFQVWCMHAWWPDCMWEGLWGGEMDGKVVKRPLYCSILVLPS